MCKCRSTWDLFLYLGHLMGFEVHVIKKLREKDGGYNYDMIKNTHFVLKSLSQEKSWNSDHRFKEYLNYQELETYRDSGGLRIEEDFVIINFGPRLFGNKLPKHIEDFEASIRLQIKPIRLIGVIAIPIIFLISGYFNTLIKNVSI